MGLQKVKQALLTVDVPVYHYEAPGQEDRYLVWAEDAQGAALWADGRMENQAIQGAAHYFTRTEYDPTVEKIQAALRQGDLSWRLNSIQFEEDTGYTHYEWIWEVDGWPG